MEQARYWIWTNRKHVFASQNASSNNSSPPSYGDSWEEQAFAEDAAGSACVWPPRSYSCSFCRREFKSAQALGGHMNVHRRDRARLKQSPSQHDAVNHLPPMMVSYNHTSSPSPVRVSSSPPLPEKMELGLTTPPFFSTVLSENYSARARSNLVADKCFHHVRDLTASAKSNEQEYVKTDLSTLNLLFSRTRDESEDHDGEIPRCNKRRRIDYEASSPDNLLWKSSDTDHVQGRYKRFQPDHVPPKLMSGAGELDLELRLGDPPKV